MQNTNTNNLETRIREMAQSLAFATFTSGVEDACDYEKFMEAEDVHKVVQIWEPFENDCSETIKEYMESEADSLVNFANAIINQMSTADLLDIIQKRARDEELVESATNVRLLAIKEMSDSEKDELVRSGGNYVGESDDILFDIDNCESDREDFNKLKAFGISYVNAF